MATYEMESASIGRKGRGKAGTLGDNSIPAPSADDMEMMSALEKKLLWLSSWMIHHANHVRPNVDGLKVGGHQASSASLVTLMTALFFHVLRPDDRVAVKPHASPVFHAIQYLFGNQTRDNLENFRALGGAQSYPSRTKDVDDVDFSTGSVGLGVGVSLFAALIQDYVRLKRLPGAAEDIGRMVALVGDAELDEGNIYEALLEGWKHDVRNVWWVIDYNRQSLDSVVSDRLFTRIDELFATMGWRVITLKYGRLLEAAFARPGGDALRDWIDRCPNSLYAALTFKGGAAWREHLAADIGKEPGIADILADHDDEALGRLMTNLAGHDLETVLEGFRAAADSDQPTCFLAYTIKGFGLPFAGHKDNHAGLMNVDQMAAFQQAMAVPEGAEWEPFAGLSALGDRLGDFVARTPFNARGPRRTTGERLPIPMLVAPAEGGAKMSTQEGFGRILNEIGRSEEAYADRIVTTSPDVTVSTNLGAWVNRRGVFNRQDMKDVFREQKVVSAQTWAMSPAGQHIELGIAENNLFLLLAAAGLSHSLFGSRLLPIGTLYDPFIARGLDALNYACYQDARFVLVATPSGITLAPEGGAHQSIATPLIGMAQDGLAYFEPAYCDELAAILGWALDYIQRDGSDPGRPGWLRDTEGGSVYLRLSTRALEQPARTLSDEDRQHVIDGGYWLRPPGPGATLALVCTGAVMPEVLAAFDEVLDDAPDAGLMVVTSPDRLNAGWHAAERARERADGGDGESLCHIERLLAPLSHDAALVTVLDGHPATLAWLGAVAGHHVQALGVEHFGQSGSIPDLYRRYGIDTDGILDATARACLDRLRL